MNHIVLKIIKISFFSQKDSNLEFYFLWLDFIASSTQTLTKNYASWENTQNIFRISKPNLLSIQTLMKTIIST